MMKRREQKSILRVIMVPLIIVLVIQMLLFVMTVILGGVVPKLKQNARDIFSQQVENRGNDLMREMTGTWSNLSDISEAIDAELKRRFNNGKLSMNELNYSNPNVVAFLKEIQPKLIQTMYDKRVSGIFVVLNTKSLDGEDVPESLLGIYMRDRDPLSTPSLQYGDTMFKCAPVDLLRSGMLSADTSWTSSFSTGEGEVNDFYYHAFQTAYEDRAKLDEEDYGYWTREAYRLTGDSSDAISYSVPLILENGTVYGVVGIEILGSYLESLLPVRELADDLLATYFLAVAEEGSMELRPVIYSSNEMDLSDIEQAGFALKKEGASTAIDRDGVYFASAMQLRLYTNNAPFDSDKWFLLGAYPVKNLYSFADTMHFSLVFSVVLNILIGLAGIIVVSLLLSKPILKLSKKVEKTRGDTGIFDLPDIGIREIDQLTDAITELSREVVASSTRFLNIMDMASIDLAGYEIQEDSGSIYITDNYFPLLGMEGVDHRNLTKEEFYVLQRQIRNSLPYSVSEDGSMVYSVPTPQGTTRYMRSEHKKLEQCRIGLIEDVTSSVLEKMQIEQERDCDALTGLYGRRGFRREMDRLSQHPEQLKCAALLMMDLDRLKVTNDTYGHNTGDRYIQRAGKCFVENTPEGTMCARIAGDEFVILFYGYETQDEVHEKIAQLYGAIKNEVFILPNGENMGLNVSGGYAWYPQDSTSLSELQKYADFAMYQVKETRKGEIREFDSAEYQKKLFQNRCRTEFYQMLKKWQVNYHFQPIFDARTGEAYAYEALMRMPFHALNTPSMVLNIAKQTRNLHEVERMTMFRATECYQELLEQNLISDNALVFINSISNCALEEEDQQLYYERFAHLKDNIVIEITEDEDLDMDVLQRKKNAPAFSGMFALDDYGRGYNSEINLLEISPKFVKVDTSIVRNLDSDKDKQQIISNIVNYAHQRDMMIIAEGLETAEELKTALALGVDLFQGYFLARPSRLPLKISEEAYTVIQDYWKQEK